MRSVFIIGLCLAPLAAAEAEENPANCYALDYDKNAPIGVARIVGADQKIHFSKNADDDKSCPAVVASCERKAYLKPGDLVMTGRVAGAFTCVSYVNVQNKETSGWIASAMLEPRPPLSAPAASDWVGVWRSRRDTMQGEITIARGKRGLLKAEGEATYAVTPENVRTGAFGAEKIKADAPTLAFVDGDQKPFEKAEEGDCALRMSRVDKFLLVQDNGYCGGMAVTFTGLYHR